MLKSELILKSMFQSRKRCDSCMMLKLHGVIATATLNEALAIESMNQFQRRKLFLLKLTS